MHKKISHNLYVHIDKCNQYLLFFIHKYDFPLFILVIPRKNNDIKFLKLSMLMLQV